MERNILKTCGAWGAPQPRRELGLVLGAAILLGVTLAQVGSGPVPSISGTLLPAPGSPIAIEGSSLTIGDLNGDGFPDLVVVNQGSNTVSVLLGDGTGRFKPAPGSPIVSFLPGKVIIGDFNRDGKPDLALAEAFQVRILLGNGTGSFTEKIPSSIANIGGMENFTFVAGDFNGDGKLDLAGRIYGVPTGYSGPLVGIVVWLGDGAGRFTALPGLRQPYAKAMITGDFNGDGRLDLATANAGDNNVSILLGNGAGGFSNTGTLPAGKFPASLASGDFNGDGRLDLAVGNWLGNSVTIFLGDGNGGFRESVGSPLVAPTTVYSVAVGDFDGDGNQDLVVLANGIVVYLGDGRGEFMPAVGGPFPVVDTVNVGTLDVGVRDFNRDGRLDVASTGSTVGVWLGAIAPIRMALSTSANLPSVGQIVPLTATLTGPVFDAPTGTVTFLDGSAVIGTADVFNGSATLNATFATAGTHSVMATYSGDSRATASSSSPLTVTVQRANQLIYFSPIADRTYGDPPIALTATASSGLPVTFSVVSGPATLDGNVLTPTSIGAITVQASQPGNANYNPASVSQSFSVTAAVRLNQVVNAASYRSGVVAPGSYAIMFGAKLADSVSQAADTPLPLSLNGTSVEVTDAMGATSNAALYFASPARVDILIPENLASGTGSVTITTPSGQKATGPLEIMAVSPGLFTADYSGTGVASGTVQRVSAEGLVTVSAISSCSGASSGCKAVPIDLSTSDRITLQLFGTGFRNRTSLSAVTASVGGEPTEVSYADPLQDSPGLDRIDIALDSKLNIEGPVDIKVSVDGIAANTVTIEIR